MKNNFAAPIDFSQPTNYIKTVAMTRLTQEPTMTTTTEQAALIAQVRAGYHTRIANLRTALRGSVTGNVFCWRRYGLGVSFTDTACSTVAVEAATVIAANVYRKTFRNGSGEPACLMPRRDALEAALATTQAALAEFERAIKL